MQLAIYSNRRDMMNAIDATSTNNQSVFSVFLRNFAQIELKLNTKMSTIKEFYKTKKQNTTEVIS